MTRVGALFALAILVVACGIPLDSGPEVVQVEINPLADVEPQAQGELAAVSVFLVRNELLVEASRELPSPPSLTSIFGSLLDGVTEQEREENLRTSIPPGTEMISVTEDGSVLLVDLNSEFASVGGEEEILAVAQIVLTASRIEGVDLVTFHLEGVPTDVPVADGALSVNPVGFDDYSDLVSDGSE